MRAFRLMAGVVCCAGMLMAAPIGWAADDQTNANTAKPSESQALVQIYLQINTLQQQIRDLRGRNQELEHQIEMLRNRQRQLYMSTDQRLQALEAAAGGSSAAGSSGVATKAAGNTSTVGTAPAVPVSAPAVSAPTIGATGSSTGAASTAPQQAAAPAPAQASYSGKDLEAYQKAFDLLKNSHYQAAIDAFQGFEKTYPQSPYVANAEYWTGEALYVERQFQQALAQFQKVVNDYPQSNKVSASLLKVGYSQYELQQWAAARKTLQAVVNQYPGTTAARLAADRLNRMQREGH